MAAQTKAIKRRCRFMITRNNDAEAQNCLKRISLTQNSRTLASPAAVEV